MTRADIESYYDDKVRLKSIKTTIVTDSVVGSSVDYPYTSHSVTLHGVQQDAKTQVEEKQLEKKIAAVDAFVDSIADARVRNLIDLLYRKGMKWNEVEAKTGGSYNADVKCLQRFFKLSTNVHKCPDIIKNGKVITTEV